jgi:hypothetical protein
LERQVPESEAFAGELLHDATPQALEGQPAARPLCTLLRSEVRKLPPDGWVDGDSPFLKIEGRPFARLRVHHGKRQAGEGVPGEPVREPFLGSQAGAGRDQPAQHRAVDAGAPFR